MTRTATHIPPSLSPRGLRRIHAAAYVGVSPSKFDELVRDQVLPRPRKLGKVVIWDKHAIDAAFDCLFDDGEAQSPHAPNGWGAMR